MRLARPAERSSRAARVAWVAHVAGGPPGEVDERSRGESHLHTAKAMISRCWVRVRSLHRCIDVMIHINATDRPGVTPYLRFATRRLHGLLHAAGRHGVSPGLSLQEFVVEESKAVARHSSGWVRSAAVCPVSGTTHKSTVLGEPAWIHRSASSSALPMVAPGMRRTSRPDRRRSPPDRRASGLLTRVRVGRSNPINPS